MIPYTHSPSPPLFSCLTAADAAAAAAATAAADPADVALSAEEAELAAKQAEAARKEKMLAAALAQEDAGGMLVQVSYWG
jgi:hypothetical protein